MGRSSLVALTVTVGLNWGQPASVGGFWSGNDLYHYCVGSTAQHEVCVAYILGVVDTDDIVRASTGRPRCLHEGVQAEQLGDIVSRFLVDHPEQRVWPAAGLVAYSVQQGLGCR